MIIMIEQLCTDCTNSQHQEGDKLKNPTSTFRRGHLLTKEERRKKTFQNPLNNSTQLNKSIDNFQTKLNYFQHNFNYNSPLSLSTSPSSSSSLSTNFSSFNNSILSFTNNNSSSSSSSSGSGSGNGSNSGGGINNLQFTLTPDARACVTATYLCVLIVNNTWLDCNLLDILCKFNSNNNGKNPAKSYQISDNSDQYAIDSTFRIQFKELESILKDLISFTEDIEPPDYYDSKLINIKAYDKGGGGGAGGGLQQSKYASTETGGVFVPLLSLSESQNTNILQIPDEGGGGLGGNNDIRSSSSADNQKNDSMIDVEHENFSSFINYKQHKGLLSPGVENVDNLNVSDDHDDDEVDSNNVEKLIKQFNELNKMGRLVDEDKNRILDYLKNKTKYLNKRRKLLLRKQQYIDNNFSDDQISSTTLPLPPSPPTTTTSSTTAIQPTSSLTSWIVRPFKNWNPQTFWSPSSSSSSSPSTILSGSVGGTTSVDNGEAYGHENDEFSLSTSTTPNTFLDQQKVVQLLRPIDRIQQFNDNSINQSMFQLMSTGVAETTEQQKPITISIQKPFNANIDNHEQQFVDQQQQQHQQQQQQKQKPQEPEKSSSQTELFTSLGGSNNKNKQQTLSAFNDLFNKVTSNNNNNIQALSESQEQEAISTTTNKQLVRFSTKEPGNLLSFSSTRDNSNVNNNENYPYYQRQNPYQFQQQQQQDPRNGQLQNGLENKNQFQLENNNNNNNNEDDDTSSSYDVVDLTQSAMASSMMQKEQQQQQQRRRHQLHPPHQRPLLTSSTITPITLNNDNNNNNNFLDQNQKLNSQIITSSGIFASPAAAAAAAANLQQQPTTGGQLVTFLLYHRNLLTKLAQLNDDVAPTAAAAATSLNSIVAPSPSSSSSSSSGLTSLGTTSSSLIPSQTLAAAAAAAAAAVATSSSTLSSLTVEQQQQQQQQQRPTNSSIANNDNNNNLMNIGESIELTLNETRLSNELENFNSSLPIKIIIHGFGSGGRRPWVNEMVFKFLNYENVNVIVVDWEKGATLPNYVQAAGNTRLVGHKIANLIKLLNNKYNLNGDSYHLIGFSLGAHVAGFVGQEFNGSIGRITGLDPAGPSFENYDEADRLDPSDAKFVDVVHSNGDGVLRGGFGSLQQMGHLDFYPNGGRVQLGCSNVLLSALSDIIYGKWQSLCNHRRALNFFMDSFDYNKCKFKSFSCDSYESYLRGDCFNCGLNKEKCSYMGYLANYSMGRGKMYLTTHQEAPFCANQYVIKIIGSKGFRTYFGKVEVTLITLDGKNESFLLSSINHQVTHHHHHHHHNSQPNYNNNNYYDKNNQESFSSSGYHQLIGFGNDNSRLDIINNNNNNNSNNNNSKTTTTTTTIVQQHSMQSLIVSRATLANLTQIQLKYTKYKGWIYSGDESWFIDKVFITDSDGQVKSYCGFQTILENHISSKFNLEAGNCSIVIDPSAALSHTNGKINSLTNNNNNNYMQQQQQQPYEQQQQQHSILRQSNGGGGGGSTNSHRTPRLFAALMQQHQQQQQQQQSINNDPQLSKSYNSFNNNNQNRMTSFTNTFDRNFQNKKQQTPSLPFGFNFNQIPFVAF